MSTHVVGRRREGYCLLPPHLFHGEQPVVSQNIGGVSIAPPPCLRPLSPHTGEVTQRPGNCAGGGGGQERSAMANSKGRVRQHGPKPFTSLFFSPLFYPKGRSYPAAHPPSLFSCVCGECDRRPGRKSGQNEHKRQCGANAPSVPTLRETEKLSAGALPAIPLLSAQKVSKVHTPGRLMNHFSMTQAMIHQTLGLQHGQGRADDGKREASSPNHHQPSWLVCGRRAKEKDSGRACVAKGKRKRYK